MHGGMYQPSPRAVVHRGRAVGIDGLQEVGNLRRNTRRSAYSQVSERGHALPHDKRERMAEVYNGTEVSEFLLGCIVAILLFALFSIAGYVDWTADQAYQRAWAEANGVQYEVD